MKTLKQLSNEEQCEAAAEESLRTIGVGENHGLSREGYLRHGEKIMPRLREHKEWMRRAKRFHCLQRWTLVIVVPIAVVLWIYAMLKETHWI